MSNKVKTIKVSTLIKRLQSIQEAEGDLPIVFARDNNDSGYNTIDPDDDLDYSVDDNVLILYPSSAIEDTSDTANDSYGDEGEPEEVDSRLSGNYYEDEYADSYDDEGYEDDCYA